MRQRLSSLPARLVMAAATLLLIGAVASLAAGDLGARSGGREYRTPGDLAALLADDEATVVVGEDGKPLLGKDGRPLRVGKDGRTIVDSKGRPVLDESGKPLQVGSDGTVHSGRTGDRTKPRKKKRPGRLPGKKPTTPDSGSREPVVVGIAYNDAERLNEIFARYGGRARASDGGSDTPAVADYINATGGIDGRPIELRLREYDTTDGRPYDVTFAEVCNTFAEGKRPVAVITIANDDELAPCLASKGIPMINDWPTAGTVAFQDLHAGHFFQPGSLALERFASPYVRTLAEENFFRGGARVALLRYSDAYTDAAVDSALRPALKQADVRLVAEEAVPYTRSVNDISGLLSRVGSAIVRFRAANVNRVISVDNTGQLIGLFMQAAEPQGYHPRYGLSSLNSPLFLRSSLPPDPLRGAVGIGWSPITDVAATDEGAVPQARVTCTQIFERAGVRELGDRSAYGQFGAYSRCSNLLMLRTALERVDASSAAAMRTALEALGGRHQSAVAMQSELSRSRHDGAQAYRVLRFVDGCNCFRYDGGPRQF